MDSDTDFCRHYMRQNAVTTMFSNNDENDNSSYAATTTIITKKAAKAKASKATAALAVTSLDFTIAQRYRSLFASQPPTLVTRLLRSLTNDDPSITWKSDIKALPLSSRRVLTKIDRAVDDANRFIAVEMGSDCSQQQNIGLISEGDVGSREGCLLMDCFGIPSNAFVCTVDVTENSLEIDANDVSEAIQGLLPSFAVEDVRHFQRHYFPSKNQFTAILARASSQGILQRTHEAEVKNWLPEGLSFPFFRWFVGCLLLKATLNSSCVVPDEDHQDQDPLLFAEEQEEYRRRPRLPIPNITAIHKSLHQVVSELEQRQEKSETDLVSCAQALLSDTATTNDSTPPISFESACVNLSVVALQAQCASVACDIFSTNTPRAVVMMLSLENLCAPTNPRPLCPVEPSAPLITPLLVIRDSNYNPYRPM